MATKTHGMKLALTSSKEIMNLMNILNELEALYKYELKSMEFEDVDFSEYEILKTFNTEDPAQFIEDLLRHFYGIHHQRILWNCDTMLKHCADPALSHLDYNPEIKKGLDLLEKQKGKKYASFQPSKRAKQLSKLIKEKFVVIELKPEIKRRYVNCEEVKFEMRDCEDRIYYFKGTVIEFLEKDTNIQKMGRIFSFN